MKEQNLNENFILTNSLKQQCLDPNGLYIWRRKKCALDLNKRNMIFFKDSNGEDFEEISLDGAKRAKEWTFSSSLSGYGFDLLWQSGKIWSFLVDDEISCKKWVKYLNFIIDYKGDENFKDYIANFKYDMVELANVEPKLNSNEITKVEGVSFWNANNTTTRTEDFNNSNLKRVNIKIEDHTKAQSESINEINSKITNLSTVGSLQEGLSKVESTLESRKGQSNGTFEDLSEIQRDQSNNDFGSVQLSENSSELPFSTKKVIQEKKENTEVIQDDYLREQRYSRFPESQMITQRYDNEENESNQEKSENYKLSFEKALKSYKELELRYEEKEIELTSSKDQIYRLKSELDSLTSRYDSLFDYSKLKEKELLQKSREEIEYRVIKAKNENTSFFEASAKSLRAQHQRELDCLRDELATERKRLNAIIDRETQQRKRAEESESELKRVQFDLEDKNTNLEIQLSELKNIYESQKKSWERENKKMISEFENKIYILQKENKDISENFSSESELKLRDLSSKYEARIGRLEEDIKSKIIHEFESKKLAEMTEVQVKCQKEIESVRAEERKLASIEVERVRSSFLQREHETSKDLLELEKLHAQRVNRLEKQIEELSNKNDQLVEAYEKASEQLDRDESEAKRSCNDFKKILSQNTRKADEIYHELKKTQRELEESKLKESAFRDQLNQALTELKICKAENNELKLQLSKESALTHQWKKATKDLELTMSTNETSIEIARDEISMLENELHRLKEENYVLKQDLLRSDKLIYGVPQHQPDKRSVLQNIENKACLKFKREIEKSENRNKKNNKKLNSSLNNSRIKNSLVGRSPFRTKF